MLEPQMSEEELRGVCTTADALIEFCNKQVGAARADAGDPRDVLLCNLLTYVQLIPPFA